VYGIGLATENVITLAQSSEKAMEDFAASMTSLLGADKVKQL